MFLSSKENYKILLLFSSLVLALLIFRLMLIDLLNIPLHYDESQYWIWSKSLDWGYFSKPPFLAWLISFTTLMCGNSEFCLRASSPIFHSLTSLLVTYTTYILSKNKNASIISGLIYLLMPGITFSSFFISTDVPLLFFSTLFGALLLNFYKKRKGSYLYLISLSVVVALSFLSKYAAVYLLLSVLLCLLCVNSFKKALLTKGHLLSIILTIFFLSPHFLWNYQNQFVTLNHTLDNANISSFSTNFVNPIFFLISQLLIFGFIPFLVILRSIYFYKKLNDEQVLLLIMFLTPIILVMLLALFSRANANWAVVGFPFGCILIGTLNTKIRFFSFKSNIINQSLFSVLLLAVIFNPLGVYNPFNKISHAKDLGNEIKTELSKRKKVGFLADDREDYAHVLYYLGDMKISSAKWNGDHKINDHFELTTDVKNLQGLDVIFLTRTKPTEKMLELYPYSSKLKSLNYKNGRKFKKYNIYLLSEMKQD